MDTKWKNMVKVIKKFIKEYYDCVFGFLLFIIGSFLFFEMLVNRYYYSTWGVWRICLIGNILVQPGICLLVRRYMKLRYRNWSQKGSAETYLQDTEDSIYYQTWKAKEKQSEKRFRNILAVELSAAAAYLFFISYSSGWGWNYAAGYMMVATVFIEYICCREVIQRYWRNELDQIMEQTESFFQKRLEQALEIERKSLEKVSRSDQLRVDLITNVSHDIKTPLTSIINYVDILKRSDIADEKILGYLDILEVKAQRLKTLTEDVVEASKVSSGNITLEYMDIDFREMVQQTEGEMAEKFAARNLSVVLNLPEEAAVIHVDGRRMWRVLENIFGNAAKYAMPGTRVYADLSVSESEVKFSLKNVSEQQLNISADELTERFIRGDISRSTEGSGLGLSIAKSLTEMQGGVFELYLDGDLFKVDIRFPRIKPM